MRSSMSIIFLLFCILLPGILLPGIVLSAEIELPGGIAFHIGGYLGYREVISGVKYDSVPSGPEVGLITHLAITDRLTIYNQFQYPVSAITLSSVSIYNFLEYQPDFDIDNLQVKTQVGKLRLDPALYNSTRVNPRTRQGVMQPQSIYWSTLGQVLTSGIGAGIDIKYHRLSLSTMIVDPTIVDPSNESSAWTTYNTKAISSKFGGYKLYTISYEMPELGLRFKGGYSQLLFNFTSASMPAMSVPINLLNLGIEWQLEDDIIAIESLASKAPIASSWFNFDRLSKGFSISEVHELDDHFALRVNYNQYISTANPVNPLQGYNRDLNIGLNYHDINYIINLELHRIEGARIVQFSDFNAAPSDYREFYVLGMNFVYFFN